MPSPRTKQQARGSDGRFRGPPLSEKQIVAWAKSHFARFGRYPSTKAGPVVDAPGETWERVYGALYYGGRGLRGTETLPNLLRRTVGMTRRTHKPVLTLDQIVAWARAQHARTGRWPSADSGRVADGNGESWLRINNALRDGHRGMPRVGSLSKLLDKIAGPKRLKSRPLSIPQILEWAENHRTRTGSWPNLGSGPINDAPGENWLKVNSALVKGHRGLPGGDSLTRLLHREAGKPMRKPFVRVSHAQILKWADAHYRRHGRYPQMKSGPVDDMPNLTWRQLAGGLELPRGSAGALSLARLLQGKRGASARTGHPPFRPTQIVAWARAFHRRTGRWPRPDDPDPRIRWSWSQINRALSLGQVSGVAAGTRLPVFLEQRCCAPYRAMSRTALSIDDILTWADRHHERTGRWPTNKAGPVVGGPKRLTWMQISLALWGGGRGLPKMGGLAQLLMKRRGAAHKYFLPTLSVKQVLAWADAYHKRHGRWPHKMSGTVLESPENSWSRINEALIDGRRGLPQGSLWQLIRRERGVTRRYFKPALSEHQVLGWAISHHRRTGRWPTEKSGAIRNAPHETWGAVSGALREGLRGLRKGRTLSGLLNSVRGTPSDAARKRPLKVQEVLLWAKAHARRTGDWPDRYDGRVTDAKDETWFGIDEALRAGVRGLRKVKSLGLLFSGLPKPRALALGRRETKAV